MSSASDAKAETAVLPDSATASDAGIAPVPLCVSDQDCKPSTVPCLVAYCDALQVCNLKAATDVMTCNDGNACTKNDQCAVGVCKGTAVDCADGSDCTLDHCLPATGCAHDNLVKPCNTNDPCVQSACQSGKCIVVNDKPCDDGNPCTADSCSAGSGCKYAVVGGFACDDNDGCTKNDTCKFGKCKGVGKSCDDGDLCTTDGCDAKSNCVHTPSTKACNDGDKCTTADACAGGKCSGTPKACADGSACTLDFCNSLTGFCDIKAAADVTACDDGNACTAGDTCADIICKPGASKGCDDGSPCTLDACDPLTGICLATPADDGAPCGKDNQCLSNGLCKAGACVGDLKVCDDKNPCTQDLCDPSSGLCTQSQLNDGLKCGDGKTCQAGVCL
ncbi:MAG: hypothetical protein FJ100_11425 [Deltaproteobacteria bacterium]|nr:hypothetical protein [Deltaproteobacteria bacterium]